MKEKLVFQMNLKDPMAAGEFENAQTALRKVQHIKNNAISTTFIRAKEQGEALREGKILTAGGMPFTLRKVKPGPQQVVKHRGRR